MAVNSQRKVYTNPAISKLNSFDDAFSGAETASYKGILIKTLYFIAVILVGIGAFFLYAQLLCVPRLHRGRDC